MINNVLIKTYDPTESGKSQMQSEILLIWNTTVVKCRCVNIQGCTRWLQSYKDMSWSDPVPVSMTSCPASASASAAIHQGDGCRGPPPSSHTSCPLSHLFPEEVTQKRSGGPHIHPAVKISKTIWHRGLVLNYPDGLPPLRATKINTNLLQMPTETDFILTTTTNHNLLWIMACHHWLHRWFWCFYFK